MFIFSNTILFTNNFDSVYRFEAEDGKGGFSVGDFDLDGKTDMAFGTVNGKYM
jgi:hypothetical protein